MNPTWLSGLPAVPAPLAITPPHPEATGSYGPDAERYASEVLRVTLRPWQRLCLYRALEHRDDGSLCWRTVLLSTPRRSGKSVLLFVILMYRLTHVFEDNTEVVLTAGKQAQAKEIMRRCWRYAESAPGWKNRRANDSPETETPDGHRMLLRPAESTAGYSPSLAVADEAWSIKPTFIDDDLNPSLLERAGGGQLLLVSTAHRRATSLMKTRIQDALSRDDGKTLLLLWGAPEGADVSDPAVHRAAQPYVTQDRLETLADTYARAAAGEEDPEFDDPDPVAGFACQLLNQWPLRARVSAPGDPLTTATEWHTRAVSRPVTAPSAAALESHYEHVTLALAYGSTVHVEAHTDMQSAVRALSQSGYSGPVIVGASLTSDPALTGWRLRKATASAAAAVEEFARLLPTLTHTDASDTDHLSGQVLAVRTSAAPGGSVRVTSKARTDAVKAAAWALAESQKGQKRITAIAM